MAREPIAYIDRTRAYYKALGFETAYQWAHNTATPFQLPSVGLPNARLALVTTAALVRNDKGDQGPGAAYNGAAKFFEPYQALMSVPANTGISHIAYDRTHTAATDQASWLPQAALHKAVKQGALGSLTKHFYGLPTNRSQRVTASVDAPALLQMLKNDNADIALLVPNCPVCHQCVAMTARHLEHNGIATVVMACAKDIVETVGTPRVLFSDFPLGNAAGKPHNLTSQQTTLAKALALFECSSGPIVATNDERWSDDDNWKQDYSNAALLSAEELALRRADFDAQKLKSRA